MRWWPLLLACLGLICLPCASTAQEVAPPSLVIDAPESLQPIAARLARIEPDRIRAVMRLVGVSGPGAPIHVVLAPEESALARRTPAWIAGFAESRTDRIVLFPSRTTSYPHDSLEALFQHEIAHVLIARAAAGAPVPRWFHEGLAMAAERRWGLEDRTRAAIALAVAPRSLNEIDADFVGSAARAGRAYALSGALVRDILRRNGPDAPARILMQIASGHTVDEAFVNATGVPVGEAERLFWRRSWIEHAVPFVTSSLVLWLGVVLLAVYAKRARNRRRAELRERWEAEEAAIRAHEAAPPEAATSAIHDGAWPADKNT